MGWTNMSMRLAMGLALVMATTSCGGGKSNGSVSRQVGPAGATVTGPGNVLVVIPAGAVNGTFTLTVSQLPSSTPPLGGALLAAPIRLAPKAQGFSQPVDVTIPVASSSAPLGQPLTGIVMLRGDTTTDEWVPVPATSAGPGLVVLQTDYLGDFAAVDATSVDFGECGDTMCLTPESCSTCPIDCGLCLDGGDVVDDGGTMGMPDGGTGSTSPLIVNADGTATDPRTGLIWERTASVTNANATDAAAACAASTLAGLTWRLPTRQEALTIINRNAITPIWYGGLPDITNGIVWTSTPSAYNPAGDAWTVGAGTGESLIDPITTLGSARCVSGNYTPPQPALIDNADGTITDTSTGLMWAKDSSPTGLDYAGAQAYCATLMVAGAGGYRLPTMDELFPLVRHDIFWPAIDVTYFPTFGQGDSIWTSTLVPFAAGWSYYIWLLDGELRQIQQTNTQLYARCVKQAP